MELLPLNKILAREEKSISPRALYLLQQPLVEELIQWRDTGKTGQQLTAQSIEISDQGKQVKILNASSDESKNIVDYGNILLNAIDHSTLHDKRLRNIAQQCANGEVANLETLHLMLERMVSSSIYKILLAVIIVGIAIMAIYQILQ